MPKLKLLNVETNFTVQLQTKLNCWTKLNNFWTLNDEFKCKSRIQGD